MFLGNLMKAALDKTASIYKRILPFPKMIVVVTDDDVINCLKNISTDLPKAFNRLVNHVMLEHERSISSFKEHLMPKSKKDGYPHILWILAPMHQNFLNNSERFKYNKAIESMCKLHSNVSCLELKKIWDPKDDGLYVSDQKRFTTEGFKKYWEAIDRTIRYCDSVILKKRDQKKLKFKPNHDQNDQYRWHNPMWKKPAEMYQKFRKLPTPPRR